MLDIQIKEFKQLSTQELYNLLQLRSEVFVVEQDCVYQDLDNKDKRSYHLLCYDVENDLIAYTRLVPKGISYPNHSSIGRVVTSDKVRRKGIGKTIMKKSIEEIERLFGHNEIKISAQCYLDKFYKEIP